MPIYLNQSLPFNQFQHSLMIANIPARDCSPPSLRIQFRYRHLTHFGNDQLRAGAATLHIRRHTPR